MIRPKGESYAPVSVVIACYNCANTVERAILSVARQTWVPAEVLLIDDCSKDDTLVKLEGLAKRYPQGWLKIFHNPVNVGAGETRNIGWNHATQSYLAFLDADDSWLRGKVETQVSWMLKNSEIVMTGQSPWVASEEKLLTLYDMEKSPRQYYKIKPWRLLLSNPVGTSSVIVRRDLTYRFATGKRRCEDYLLWCELCLDGKPCCASNHPLECRFEAAWGGSGLSGDLDGMAREERDCYDRLRWAGRIGNVAWCSAVVISFARYLRRVVVVTAGKHRRG